MINTLEYLHARLASICFSNLGAKVFVLSVCSYSIFYVTTPGGQAEYNHIQLSSELYNILLKQYKQQWLSVIDIKLFIRNRKLMKI